MSEIQLPMFETLETTSVKLAVTGALQHAIDQPDRALGLGEEITIVARGRIQSVTHNLDDSGADPAAARAGKLVLSCVYELPAEAGAELISERRRAVMRSVGVDAEPVSVAS